MRVLGIDPGKWKSYMAVLEGAGEGRYRVLALEAPDNEVLEEALGRLLEEVGFGLVVVDEPHPSPLRKGVPVGDLEVLRGLVRRVRRWCGERGVPFMGELASRSRAWYEKPPGWRQALTGLMRPSERDLFVVLMERKRRGEIEGEVPRHPGLVDAIGLAVYGVEKVFSEGRAGGAALEAAVNS